MGKFAGWATTSWCLLSTLCSEVIIRNSISNLLIIILFVGAAALCLFDRVTHRFEIPSEIVLKLKQSICPQGAAGNLETNQHCCERFDFNHLEIEIHFKCFRIQREFRQEAGIFREKLRPHNGRDSETSVRVQPCETQVRVIRRVKSSELPSAASL